MNLRRVLALTLKEWREILRDPVYLTLAFVIPVVLMVVVGHGITQEVENVGLVVLDEDRSPTSRGYVQSFVSTRHFRLAGQAQDLREADALLARGEARVVLWVGPGFLRRRIRGWRNRCLRCGYNMQANTSGICPECGTSVPFPSRGRAREGVKRSSVDPAQETAARSTHPRAPSLNGGGDP